MRRIVVKSKGWKAAPLALAALLVLGGCDDEEEKPPEVEVQVPKGTVVKVTHADDDSEMVVVGELMLTVGVVLWALFGPGATRRLSGTGSEHGQQSS